MHRNQRLATVVALLLLGGVLAAPSAVSADRSPTVPAAPDQQAATAPITAETAPASVDFLVKRFHVSTAEAVRRLELQRTAARLQQELAARFPDVYSGAWIDQEHGGILNIGATDPAALTVALWGEPDRRHIRVVRAAHARRDLLAAAERIAARAKLPPGHTPFIDDRANRVVVAGSAAAKVTAAGAARVLAGDASMTVVDTTPIDGVPTACTIANCTPPMRGGLRLYIFPNLDTKEWVGYCTNGFNVKGSNNWVYTLTAGHCVDGIDENVTDNNGMWVGYWNPSTFTGGENGYPTDGAIMPYVVKDGINYAHYWMANPPRNTVWDTRISSLYHITGWYTYNQIGIGWIVCSTGATSQTTACGWITGKNGGLKTNICVRPGDSGGPLFSEIDQKAYGIQSIGRLWNGDCFEESWVSPVSSIFAAAKAKSGLTFQIITTP